MKRREMIVKLVNAIHEYGKHYDCIHPDFYLVVAERVLNVIETNGMLPPDHFVDGWDDMFDEPVKIRICNAWEREDVSRD